MSRPTVILPCITACVFAIAISFSHPVGPLAVQAQQPDQLVDQTRKNIQVLKGLQESQLTPLMNFVAVSLGVQCNYCHVANGKDPKTGFTNWTWESDDKPKKLTARRMMQMVLSINGTNKIDFRQNSVTCYSCHRGQTTPVSLPSMPLLRSGHEPGPNDPEKVTTTPASLSVDEILAKYIRAVGGTAATATKTLVMKGKREASQNRIWQNEINYVGPDKFSVIVTTQQAVIRQVVNGDKGWVLNGANLRTLTPEEAIRIRQGWEEVFGVVKVRGSPSMVFGGMQKIGERDAYVVVNATENRTERYYFDVSTGLLVRKATITHTALLPLPEQIDFEDYRDVEGVKLPFTIRNSAIDTFSSWTRTFTEIKRNVAVGETTFAMPQAPPN